MQVLVIKEALEYNTALKIRQFYAAQQDRTVFQSVEFYNFFLSVPFYKPLYLIATEADEVKGILLAVLIREGNGLLALMSQRCVVYGGPLAASENPEILQALLKKLNKTVERKALFTQFRNFKQWNEGSEHIFEQNGYVLRDRLNSFVPLQEKRPVAMQFSAGRRRQLKKALQTGVVVREAKNEAEVDQLYDLLEDLYRQKVKKPLPGRQFFRLFYSQLVAQGAGIILLVWYQQQLIGGIVSPITSGISVSELYVCGLDKKFPECHPSTVATWAAMDYGQRNGLQYFDFMGLGRPDTPYGVRDFKLRFGGNEVNLGRYGRRNQKIMYGLAELGYNIWRGLRSRI